MAAPKRSTLAVSVLVIVMLLAMAASGCTNPLGDPKPSVTLTAPYKAPSPTPLPSPTAVPSPSTSWNGMYVKLHGNVTAGPDEHVYGTVKVYYMDKNYWDDIPSAPYDTDDGGAYSLDVRAKVPFKVDFGYLYVGQLPGTMTVKRLDPVYVLDGDTPLDIDVATSAITPKN